MRLQTPLVVLYLFIRHFFWLLNSSPHYARWQFMGKDNGTYRQYIGPQMSLIHCLLFFIRKSPTIRRIFRKVVHVGININVWTCYRIRGKSEPLPDAA